MARGQFDRKDYINCSLGKWRMKTTKDNPNAVARIAQQGDPEAHEVWEIVYDFVEGTIKKIGIEKSDKYDSKWCIEIHDGTDKMLLQMSVNSGYASATITKLLNADISKPVKFVPYYFAEEKKARMVLYQGEEKIQSKYTKDNPGLFPVFPDTGEKDDITLWKISVNKFLTEQVKQFIVPKLPDLSSPEEKLNELSSGIGEGPEPPSSIADDAGFSEDDDLPF